jgi:hypothetical protein
MNEVGIFFVIGLVFSPLAAACAFIITFQEYKHHFPDNHEPVKMAFQTAIMTFIVFLLLSVMAGFFFRGVVSQ